MKPFYDIIFLIFLSSCMLSKDVAISVLKPSQISVHDSIKTVLVVNNSYDVPTIDLLEKKAYDTIQLIAYRSFINNLSKKYNVEYCFLDHISVDEHQAGRLCKKYNADLLINMRKIQLSTAIPTILIIPNPKEYTFRDEKNNVVCARCNAHYQPIKNPIPHLEYISPMCPWCGSPELVTQTVSSCYIKEIRNGMNYPNINVKTDWVIYDNINRKYYRQNNMTKFKINEESFEEIYKISGTFNIILDKLLFPSFNIEKRSLLYSVRDSAFRRSIRYVNQGEWSNAAEIWRRYLICPSAKVRKAAYHNLAVYYEREGDLLQAKRYYLNEKSEGFNSISSDIP